MNEKPYSFLDFKDHNVNRGESTGHHRFMPGSFLSGWLEIDVVTLRPLQIASGNIDLIRISSGEKLVLTNASISRVEGNRQQEVYYIPGSSFKGAIRSMAEALSRSCLTSIKPANRRFVPPALGRCSGGFSSLCPACRIFGAMDYASRVQFEDVTIPSGKISLKGTPSMWSPARSRRGLPGRYLDRGVVRGRKFYLHSRDSGGPELRQVVKEGVSMTARIYFENLAPSELGLMISAMGCHPDYKFPFKIGAVKPVGMGSVKVDIKAANFITGEKELARAGRLGRTVNSIREGDLIKIILQWANSALELKLVEKDRLSDLAVMLRAETLNDPAINIPY